ncbi:UNVERIFIED_CONTAM: hypothetical protein Sindi_0433200 [Sesamum indicum]
MERQRKINPSNSCPPQNMAMQITRTYEKPKGFQKRKTNVDKKSQICKECGKTGHTKEVCFEIYGFPDWYKTLVEQRKGSNRASMAAGFGEQAHNATSEGSVVEIVRTELQKYFGGMESGKSTTTSIARIDYSDGTQHSVVKTGNILLFDKFHCMMLSIFLN